VSAFRRAEIEEDRYLSDWKEEVEAVKPGDLKGSK
jgi:hypothetical protein